jgi:hypothetical protein
MKNHICDDNEDFDRIPSSEYSVVDPNKPSLFSKELKSRLSGGFKSDSELENHGKSAFHPFKQITESINNAVKNSTSRNVDDHIASSTMNGYTSKSMGNSSSHLNNDTNNHSSLHKDTLNSPSGSNSSTVSSPTSYKAAFGRGQQLLTRINGDQISQLRPNGLQEHHQKEPNSGTNGDHQMVQSSCKNNRKTQGMGRAKLLEVYANAK